jgi:hypothetical protein
MGVSMAVRSDQRPWVRKLDGDLHVVPEQPQLRLYPNGFDEVLECFRQLRNPPLGGIPEARAIGSHWCISKAGVTPGYMIETATPVHEPASDQAASRLNHVLYDVIPACLSTEALRFFHTQHVPVFNSSVTPDHKEIYLFHVEAGMRIHELYSVLDGFRDGVARDDASFNESLAGKMCELRGDDGYRGPWALETMGGAGGQTIGGVISTATHGGDLAFGAISDAVVALHLIGPDGQHHWIERTRLRPTALPLKLVDEVKLKQRYNHRDFGEIHYHRDDNLMNAVVVACGRMGMIYSVVLRVVRQYALLEQTSVFDWQQVRTWITDPTNPVFDVLQNRFARIDINTYGGFWNPTRRRCYVISRKLHELDKAGVPPLGRAERAGTNAGKNHALGAGDGHFSNPCASDNWIRDGLKSLYDDFETIRDDAVEVWLVLLAVILFPFTPGPIRAAAVTAQVAATATIQLMQTLMLQITTIRHLLPNTVHFGDTLAGVMNTCADLGLIPIAGELYERASDRLHAYDPEHPRTPAISYAAMDEHDYLNVGCVAPGDSIEFFVDADTPELPKFIDHVLGRVIDLQFGVLTDNRPQLFGGYISLRFMTQSEALLATQIWPRTCSIEIAGLSRVRGTEPLLKALEEDAKNFPIVLHWGQRNDWPMRQIEQRFSPVAPSGSLFKWRSALADLSDHGRYTAFSTAFSKRKGLEVTTPLIKSFSVRPTEGCAGEPATVTWDALSNPPETEALLVQVAASGAEVRIALGSLMGSRQMVLLPGRSTLRLVLERRLNNELFVDQQDIQVRGFSMNEQWRFMPQGVPRLVDGVNRWAAEISLFSQFISNHLRVSAVSSTCPGAAVWWLRNSDVGDIQFSTGHETQPLAALPVFNRNWLFFSDSPAAGTSPTFTIDFTLTC